MPPFKIGMAAVGPESLEFAIIGGLRFENLTGVDRFWDGLFVEYDGVREGEMVQNCLRRGDVNAVHLR